MPLELQSKTLRECDAAKYLGMSRSWLAQARMHGNPMWTCIEKVESTN